MSFGSLLQFTHYSVASRVPPERHDDVEDVVGRTWGDVPPENTHELSALVALVDLKPAGRVNAAHVNNVFGATNEKITG